MNRVNANYFIYMGLLVCFILVFVTGIIKLPSLHGFAGSTGFNMATITDVHNFAGMAMGVLAILHVALNRRAITQNTRRLLRRGSA